MGLLCKRHMKLSQKTIIRTICFVFGFFISSDLVICHLEHVLYVEPYSIHIISSTKNQDNFKRTSNLNLWLNTYIGVWLLFPVSVPFASQNKIKQSPLSPKHIELLFQRKTLVVWKLLDSVSVPASRNFLGKSRALSWKSRNFEVSVNQKFIELMPISYVMATVDFVFYCIFISTFQLLTRKLRSSLPNDVEAQ